MESQLAGIRLQASFDILPRMRISRLPLALLLMTALALVAPQLSERGAQQPTGAAFEAETLQHYQALLRLDTSSPPGNETRRSTT